MVYDAVLNIRIHIYVAVDMKMSSEDGVDDKTNMDEGEHVWVYPEIWGALTNIQILFGYAPESMTTDLIGGITHDKLIEIMMNAV